MTLITIHPTVKRFIDSLQPETRKKVSKEIDSLKELGRALPPPYAKKLDNSVFELRTLGKIQVRLLYGFVDSEVIIVHGFIKKSNKVAPYELETARRRLTGLV